MTEESLIHKGHRQRMRDKLLSYGSEVMQSYELLEMLLFYVMMGIEYANLLALISGTGLIAGVCEAVVAAVITAPVVVALWKIRK